MTSYNCTTCGACCWYQQSKDTQFVTPLKDTDIARLSPHYRRNHMRKSKRFHLPVLADRKFANGMACVALRGTLGEAIGCSIYERRPDVCREYKPGSKACKDARKRANI